MAVFLSSNLAFIKFTIAIEPYKVTVDLVLLCEGRYCKTKLKSSEPERTNPLVITNTG